MQASITSSDSNVASMSKVVSLAEAKKWIGRRMVLRRAWLGFAKGSLCRVMCVVDFGDGPLLWFVTDDNHARDIDQVEISFIPNLFKDLSEQPSAQRLVPSENTIAQSVN